MIRFITALVLVVGALVAPWWAVAAGTVMCIVAYRRFVEALVPAVVIDLAVGPHSIVGVPWSMTLITLALMALSMAADAYLRNDIRI